MKTKIKNILKDYIKWCPSKKIRMVFLILPIIFLGFNTFKVNNDFWFLINTGKYILNNGYIKIEPFTIHEGLNFIVQQHLTDIIFYLVYSNFGITGMFILINIINIIIVYLLYKICLLVSQNQIKISLLITIIIDMMMSVSVLTTRPQIFDITFLLLEIYLLELYIKNKNSKYLIGLPIIALLMINFHSSSFLMLFIFMIPYILGTIKLSFCENEKYNIKNLIITMIIMFLVGFINPYGIEAIKYLFNSYGISYINQAVGEMKPLTIDNGLIIYIFIFIILITYYLNRKNKINIRYLLLFLGTLYLLLNHYKGIIYFLIVSILPLSYNLKSYIKEEKEIKLKIEKKDTILIIILILFLGSLYITNINLLKEEDDSLYDAANYLDKYANKNIKLYTNYNDGGYLEYRGYKCYIDSRAERYNA